MNITHDWIDDWVLKLVYTTISWESPTLEFTEEYKKLIDRKVIKHIVPKIGKEDLQTTLIWLLSRSKEYQYWEYREALSWTFYRHILVNLNKYYWD